MARKHGEYPSVREAIHASASALFTRYGVHGASLGDIAAQAKLSKGTLYYYYPTKEELTLTIAGGCLDHMTDLLLSWLDTLNREEPVKPAVARLFAAFTADGRYARLFAVILAECANEDSLLRSVVAERRQRWKVMLELGALRMQGRCPQLMGDGAELFFTLLTGHLMQSLSGMSGMSPEALAGTLLGK